MIHNTLTDHNRLQLTHDGTNLLSVHICFVFIKSLIFNQLTLVFMVVGSNLAHDNMQKLLGASECANMTF